MAADVARCPIDAATFSDDQARPKAQCASVIVNPRLGGRGSKKAEATKL